MSVARKVLAGLFGGAKVGTEGLVRRKAEERARMERQQEQAANREFDLEMMRERQAAQRAAARRSALEAKLDRKQRQEEQAALTASRMAEADYRAKSLANQQAAAEAARADRAAQQRFNNLNAVMQQFGAQEARMIDALSVPYTEEKRKTMLADIAKGYGFSGEEINRLYGTLPDLASIRKQGEPTETDRYLESQFEGMTEEELGNKYNELVNLRDRLEAQGVKLDRRELNPFMRNLKFGTELGTYDTYQGSGGTYEQQEEHYRVQQEIDKIEEMLNFGSRSGFDYVPSGDG